MISAYRSVRDDNEIFLVQEFNLILIVIININFVFSSIPVKLRKLECISQMNLIKHIVTAVYP